MKPAWLLPAGAQRRVSALGLGVMIALGALVGGALLAFAGPLIAAGVLLAAIVAIWALTSLEVGLWAAIGIITLLPFAALPFKVVFTPSFLDLALGGAVLVYIVQWMTGRRRRLTLTPAHGPLAVFLALAVFSFVAGMPNGPLTTNLIRQFAELLLNIALSFVIVDYVDDWTKLARLTAIVLLGGTAAAVLGILLYALPPALANRALSALAPFGYPAGEVLRYVEDNPLNAQRAIATSVDPNFLGGLLAMVGGLMAPQLLTRRPVLRWPVLTYGAFAAVLACLVLTYSRGAMAGLALAVGGIALLRYRRLLPLMLLATGLLLILPAAREYVLHFVEGVQGQDLATQMRLGEYKDAFILIQRYPVLGVGFSGTPEIDIYLGVSSAYLLMAEQMGLVGLAAFLIVVAVVFGWAFGKRRSVYALEAGAPHTSGRVLLWLGAHAGLAAALAVGVVDHYFFELSFQPAGALFWMFVGLCLAATRLGAAAESQRGPIEPGPPVMASEARSVGMRLQ